MAGAAGGNKLFAAFGEISVKLDLLQSGLAKAEGMVRSSMEKIRSLMTGFSGAMGVGLGGLGGFLAVGSIGTTLGAAAMAADKFGGAMKYAGLVFGESSTRIANQIDRMSLKFGVLRKEAIRGSAEIGEVFRRAGATGNQAARLTSQLLAMTVATARIRDVNLPDALKAVEYGLEGSTRGLRQLGVNIRETQVDMLAMRIAAKMGGSEFLETATVMARSILITRAMEESVKSLDSAEVSLGTRLKIGWANIQRVMETLGKAIKPISDAVVGGFVYITSAISSWVSKNEPNIRYFSEYVVWAFDQVVEAAANLRTKIESSFPGIGTTFIQVFDSIKSTAVSVFEEIGFLWRNWSLLGEKAAVVIMGKIANVQETFSWLQDMISAFLDWFTTNWRDIFADAFNYVVTALINLGQNFRDFGKAAYDWIASGFTKPFSLKMTMPLAGAPAPRTPAFVAPKLKLSDTSEKLAEIDTKIAKNEEKRLKKLKSDEKKPGEPSEKKPKLREQAYPAPLAKTAASEFMGLTDYAKKLQIGALSTSIDFQKQTAINTGRIAQGIEELIQKNPTNAAVAAGPD